MISDFDGSLGSRYFLNVANERTCFASRRRVQFRVDLSCFTGMPRLLTKTLLTFLSWLNQINAGCEEILPVSGSFWSKVLKF